MEQDIINEINDLYLASYITSMTGKSIKSKFMCFTGHDNKTPSMVYYDKPFVHMRCFGCGKTFNIYDAAYYLEGLSFKDALYKFAKQYGYEDKLYENQVKPDTVIKVFDKLKKFALNFDPKYLKPSVKQYLEYKQISIDDMKRYGIGYIGNNKYVLNMLNNEFGVDTVSALGLDNPVLLVEESILFFINNKYGETVGLTRRYCGNKNYPKYVNVKNNVLYKKSDTLYGLDLVAGKKPLYIVEGQTDAISLWKNNVNAVAISGTAFNENTLHEVYNTGIHNIILCFDNDTAGTEATYKVVNLFYESNIDVNLYVKQLDQDLDIDEYINKYGFKQFESVPVQEPFEFVTKYILQNNDTYHAVEQIGDMFAKYNSFNLLNCIDIISTNLNVPKDKLYNYLNNRIIQAKLQNINQYMVNIEDNLKKLKQDYEYLLERHLFANTDVGQVFDG